MAIVRQRKDEYHITCANVGDSRLLAVSFNDNGDEKCGTTPAPVRAWACGGCKKGGGGNPKKHRVTAAPDIYRAVCHAGDF
eukprot:gene24982-13812_t